MSQPFVANMQTIFSIKFISRIYNFYGSLSTVRFLIIYVLQKFSTISCKPTHPLSRTDISANRFLLSWYKKVNFSNVNFCFQLDVFLFTNLHLWWTDHISNLNIFKNNRLFFFKTYCLLSIQFRLLLLLRPQR